MDVYTSFNREIMRMYLKNIGMALLLMFCQSICAKSGLLFDVTATGTPAHAGITLCLNGAGPISSTNFGIGPGSLGASPCSVALCPAGLNAYDSTQCTNVFTGV